MRKNILLILILILSIFIVGCSSSGEKLKDESGNTPPEDNVVVGDEDNTSEETTEGIYDIEVGKPAPDLIFENKEGETISLKNLKGEEVSLEDYKGKIIFLNFWATWCVYCDMEMPDLQKLQNENDDMVVVAVDVEEDKDTVEEYINKGKYEFEVVLDEKGKVAEKYLISAFPTTYIINKEGILLGRVPGMMVWDQMVEVLKIARESE